MRLPGGRASKHVLHGAAGGADLRTPSPAFSLSRKPAPACPSTKLPVELWAHIFRFLPPLVQGENFYIGDAAAVRATSRTFAAALDIAQPHLRDDIASGGAGRFLRAPSAVPPAGLFVALARAQKLDLAPPNKGAAGAYHPGRLRETLRMAPAVPKLGLASQRLTERELRPLLDEMDRLVELDLSRNRIRAVDRLFSRPSLGGLQTLNLANNPLEPRELVAGLMALPSLRSLDLSNVDWGTSQAQALQAASLRNLHTFVFAGNPRAAGVIAVLPWAELSELRVLDLSDNGLMPQGVRALPQAMLAQLFELNLAGNALGSAMATCLPMARLGGLTKLDLSRNCRGEHEPAPCPDLSALCNLRFLRLEDNRMGELGEQGLPPFTLPQLRSLFLSGNGLHALQGWRSNLLGSPHLEVLRLSNNQLTAYTIAELDLHKLGELRVLELSGNALGNDGAQRVATLGLPNLRFLSMGANGISALPAAAMPFACMPKLTGLNLRSNELCREHGLSSGNLPNLRILYLGNNRLGKAGSGLRALETLSGLTELELADNEFGANLPIARMSQLRQLLLSAESSAKLLPALPHIARMNQLRELHLEPNDFSPREVSLLAKVLHSNLLYLGLTGFDERSAEQKTRLEERLRAGGVTACIEV